MRKKHRKLKSSKDLKFIIPGVKDSKLLKPKIKLLTQVHTVRTARILAGKIDKFIALAS